MKAILGKYENQKRAERRIKCLRFKIIHCFISLLHPRNRAAKLFAALSCPPKRMSGVVLGRFLSSNSVIIHHILGKLNFNFTSFLQEDFLPIISVFPSIEFEISMYLQGRKLLINKYSVSHGRCLIILKDWTFHYPIQYPVWTRTGNWAIEPR